MHGIEFTLILIIRVITIQPKSYETLLLFLTLKAKADFHTVCST